MRRSPPTNCWSAWPCPPPAPRPRCPPMCRIFFILSCIALWLTASPLRAETPAETAARIDTMLEHGARNLPPVVDDATFLRRVSLDLAGKVPDREAMHRFVRDNAGDKRVKVVDELLKSDAYAVNWGRYWRDAVTYHTPASANYLRWQLFD